MDNKIIIKIPLKQILEYSESSKRLDYEDGTESILQISIIPNSNLYFTKNYSSGTSATIWLRASEVACLVETKLNNNYKGPPLGIGFCKPCFNFSKFFKINKPLSTMRSFILEKWYK